MSSLYDDPRVAELLLKLWNANAADREAGIAVAELPERLRDEVLLVACSGEQLVEFGRRNHCHVGPDHDQTLVLEEGWDFTCLDDPKFDDRSWKRTCTVAPSGGGMTHHSTLRGRRSLPPPTVDIYRYIDIVRYIDIYRYIDI